MYVWVWDYAGVLFEYDRLCYDICILHYPNTFQANRIKLRWAFRMGNFQRKREMCGKALPKKFSTFGETEAGKREGEKGGRQTSLLAYWQQPDIVLRTLVLDVFKCLFGLLLFPKKFARNVSTWSMRRTRERLINSQRKKNAEHFNETICWAWKLPKRYIFFKKKWWCVKINQS